MDLPSAGVREVRHIQGEPWDPASENRNKSIYDYCTSPGEYWPSSLDSKNPFVQSFPAIPSTIFATPYFQCLVVIGFPLGRLSELYSRDFLVVVFSSLVAI